MKTQKTVLFVVIVLMISLCMISFTGCFKKMSAQEMQQENQQLIDEADQMEVESDK